MVWWFGRLVAWLFVWAFGQFVVCLCVWLVGWLVGWLFGRLVYPFVLPDTIVCGCGNQVLSKTVQEWIRSNDRVSNAPKVKVQRSK